MSQERAKSEFAVVGALSLLYVFRMLGLFMVFPVMMVYGAELHGATPALLGLALGCYGFTQAIFQIPLGMLSDRIGRKAVIGAGLLLFVLGSVIAATADNVWQVIIGRALQGSGAIASALMALVGDVTSEKNRTKAMAMIGISIGLSFTIAISVGPAIASFGGLSSIFWCSAVLAGLGLLVLFSAIPEPERAKPEGDSRPGFVQVGRVFSDFNLLRLDFGVFSLHFILAACFVILPLQFEAMEIKTNTTYLWVMLSAFVLMMPFMYLSERKHKLKAVFLSFVALISVGQLAFIGATASWQWIGLLLVFFVAFNLLEATLPSMVSKLAPAGAKGAAMGVFSTCQFLGAALGGALGGYLYSQWGSTAVFICCAVLAALWFIFALPMTAPKALTSLVIQQSQALDQDKLRSVVPGVVEVNWAAEQCLLYLKVDRSVFEREKLDAYLDQAPNTQYQVS